MRLLAPAITLLSAVSLVIAAPTRTDAPDLDDHPPDGMPNPSPSELKEIEQNAHGTLPNGPPPPVISDLGIVNLKLIAFNELFEVAFFDELITNITENVKGYTFPDENSRKFVLEALQAILAVNILLYGEIVALY